MPPVQGPWPRLPVRDWQVDFVPRVPRGEGEVQAARGGENEVEVEASMSGGNGGGAKRLQEDCDGGGQEVGGAYGGDKGGAH